MKRDDIAIQNSSLRVAIRPSLGGGIVRFDAWHRETWQPLFRPLTGNSSNPEQLACCPLVPWSNRIHAHGFNWRGSYFAVPSNRAGEPTALHGDGWLSSWRTVQHDEHSAQVELDASDREPFSYRATLHYSLSDCSLAVATTVTHMGSQAMPYGLGLHPWFVRDPDTEIAFKSVGRREPGSPLPPRELRLFNGCETINFSADRSFPSETIDHEYVGWDGKARVTWPNRQLAVQITAGPECSRLVLYSPYPSQGFFCLEPITHSIAAHSSNDPLKEGLVELANGEKLSSTVVFNIHHSAKAIETTKTQVSASSFAMSKQVS